MKTKILTLTILTVLTLSMSTFLIQPSAATEGILMSNQAYITTAPAGTQYNIKGNFNVTDPNSGFAQRIQFSSPSYVYYVDVPLYRANNPDGYVLMAICTQRTDAYTAPNMTDIKEASTTSLLASAVGTGITWTRFEFSGQYQFSAGVNYYIVLYGVAGTNWGETNYIYSKVDSTDYVGGAFSAFQRTTGGVENWNSGNNDLRFVVDGNSVPIATPTPTPTPSGNPYQYWNGTHWINYTPSTPEPNIFENGVAAPYIQMMVPIIILAAAALLGYKFAGAWGFFAGLNIGAILSYMILGSSVFPLWGIVALLVIDGLLLFGKIGLRS